jgi:hypothetical protein
MKTTLFRLFLATAFLAALAARGLGATTVKSSIQPPQVDVGDEVTVTYTVSGDDVQDFELPAIDGLTPEGASNSSQIVMNGFSVTQSFSHTFLLVPNHAGSVIIPAVDLHTPDGKVIRTQAMTLHVVGAASAPSAQAQQNVSPSNPADSASGPVVMPPPGASDGTPPQEQQPGTVQSGSTSVPVPTDPDGQPARVFDVITPQTTTAYVGQAVPLRIESYIRVDASAQQDSLPTLIGSDFLMNNLSLRPSEEGVNVGDIEYVRDSWVTAISAPKAGDFPLQATRDTYWSRNSPPIPNDPFGGLFGRPAQLMHKDILSNKLVMHILPLPDQNRPAGFTGAIGKFQVSGNAVPVNVGVGEPVTLRFTVTGEGNFDYVRSPALTSSSAWKAYNATSKTTYQDESNTQAMKIFEQAVIPRKNGVLPLPSASFSYFDPDAKQYVTIPVQLPSVSVTGEMPATASAEASFAGSDVSNPAATPGTPAPAGFAPNRLAFGSLTADLAPAYRHASFWIVQAILAVLIIAGSVLLLLRPQNDPSRGERASRLTSLGREEDAMDQAVREGDAVKFFTAARRATQLRLADHWHVAPESLTLAEIGRRDPALAETVAPLFVEADDVIYSGAARSGIDLNEWNRRAREMVQPASL